MTARFSPPPKRNPLGKRNSAIGGLYCYVSTDDAGRPQPYRLDERRRPLWRFLFRYQGQARTIPAKDWLEATTMAANVKIEMDATRAASLAPPLREGSTLTVAGLIEEFTETQTRKGRARPQTIEGYRHQLGKHVLRTLGTRPITGVTRRDISDLVFKGERTRFPSARTHNKLVGLLGSVFAYAVAMGYLDLNPVVGAVHRVAVKGERVRTMLSLTDLDAIVAGALKHEDARVGVGMVLAALGGLRLREVTHVRVQDVRVDSDYCGVRVDTGFTCWCGDCKGGTRLTKTNKARWVPLLPQHGAVLAARIAELRDLGLTDPDLPLMAVTEPRSRAREVYGKGPQADVIADMLKASVTATLKRDLGPRERCHILRAAARVRLSHAGLGSEIIDRVLGHQLPGVRQAYDWADDLATYQALCRAFGIVPPPKLVKTA